MTTFRRFLSFVFVLATLFCIGWSGADAAQAPRYPQRIISLSPGVTEILFALGLGSRVVGDTDYCDYPPAAKTKTHIGAVVPNYEAVVALRPDLIIADREANAQAVPRLEALHLPLLLIHSDTLADVENNILIIGRAMGTTLQARKVVAVMRQKQRRAAHLRAKLPGTLRTLVVVEFDPLIVAGKDSFVGGIVDLAGGGNPVDGSYIPYSKEAAIASNPQVIVCGKEDVPRLRQDPAWRSTPAVKLGNIFTVDENLIDRPGPRLADALVALALDYAHAAQ